MNTKFYNYNQTKYILLFVLSSFFFSFKVHGQPVDSSSENITQAEKYAVSLYHNVISNQLLLYNGPVYKEFPKPYQGSPYFEEDLWQKGSILYNGEKYENIPMLYDVYNDEVIVEHYERNRGSAHFRIDKEKVDYFTFLGAKFIMLKRDSANRSGMRPGYYELLYAGDLNLLVSRRKELDEDISSNKLVLSFIPNYDYFIFSDKHYYPVKNKRSVFRIFPGKKKSMKKFIKKNHLRFKSASRENSLTKLVDFIDHTPY